MIRVQSSSTERGINGDLQDLLRAIGLLFVAVSSLRQHAGVQQCILLLELEGGSAIDAFVLFLVEPLT